METLRNLYSRLLRSKARWTMRKAIASALVLALGAACSGGGTSSPAPVATTIAFASATGTVSQSAGSVTLDVSRVTGTTGAVSVAYATSDGTAAAGSDYTAQTGTLNWADGDAASKTIIVPVSNVKPFAGSKTFSVTLSGATGAASLATPTTETVSIAGSGSAGALALSTATYAVAESGGSLMVTVNRSVGSAGAVSVSYATADGTAAAGSDYTATSGLLSWADGDAAAKTFSVPISNAVPFTGTRAFTVALSSASGGATLGSPATATATITGDGAGGGAGTIGLSTSTYSVSQSGGTVIVTVNRSAGSSGAIGISYATSDGTATAGTDYTATSGTLNWASGDAGAKTFAVPISNAVPFTGTRTFSVTLTAPTGGAALGSPAMATVSIAGGGVAGTIALSRAAYPTSQSGGTVTITVNRNSGSAGAVAINYATSNGTAAAGSDYTAASGTLNWAAGDGVSKTFVVPVSNAAPFTGTRTFSVTLSGVTGGATLGSPAIATVTITGSGAGPGTLALSASSYAIAQSGGAANITVTRTAGSTGAVSVNFATANGTAAAGSDYTATSGTLNWATGDAASKSFSVPVSNGTPFTGSRTFSVNLTGATGGAGLGSPSSATVTISGSGTGALSIRVSGNRLVDGGGNTVQLRGVNVSGLESVAVNGYSPSNPWAWGSNLATPNWTTIRTWGVANGPTVINAVRIPLNESSWLNQTCTDVLGDGQTLVNGNLVQNTAGQQVKADPGGNYQATVAQTVADATAAGLYVILDLHWSAPNVSPGHPACPGAQQSMADQDNSLTFWTSVATAFKGSPNVIFELFNEPFLDATTLEGTTSPWTYLLTGGGTLDGYIVGGGAVVLNPPAAPPPFYVTWKNAGMQQMLDAVRATGATNVVLTAPLNYASSMDQWLSSKPTDSLTPSQIGAVWHAYSAADQGYPAQVSCYDPDASPQLTLPTCSAIIMTDVQAIAAQYPVVITEFGDTITTSAGTTAPWASVLLPFSDRNGLSYLGWTWNPWQGFTSDVLITDDNGTPTFGYGQYVQQHYQCVAAGTKNCP